MAQANKEKKQKIREVQFSDGRRANIIRTTDPQGRIVEHAELVDRYSKLLEQGRITEDEATSARRFHRLFTIANLYGTTSTLVERSGGVGGGITETQNDARVEINSIQKELGGDNILKSALWNVVGAEMSISDWIAVLAQNNRIINANNATGALCVALEMLEKYYRKRDKRK